MHIVRHDSAPAYDAPGHSAMAMRRLQGREAGPSDTAWIGLSMIEPGGGTTAAASSVEKFYVVLDGELLVRIEGSNGTQSAVLGPLDSCRIAPGESRELINASKNPCRVLLVMPNV